jgi:hypothetical protein
MSIKLFSGFSTLNCFKYIPMTRSHFESWPCSFGKMWNLLCSTLIIDIISIFVWKSMYGLTIALVESFLFPVRCTYIECLKIFILRSLISIQIMRWLFPLSSRHALMILNCLILIYHFIINFSRCLLIAKLYWNLCQIRLHLLRRKQMEYTAF